jgi:hypothetical protein
MMVSPILALVAAITAGPVPLRGAPVSRARSVIRPDTAGTDTLVTIEGLVRDVACAVQNPAATATRFNLQCTRDCAKRGSPLIILGANGVLYVPMSRVIPDSSERNRLMPFLGKYVRVKGTVFERSGLHAVTIASIEEVKGVHLITDAQ